MEKQMSKRRHGSAGDRGAADAYYGRPLAPHYFKGATYTSEKVEKADMTHREIKEYTVAYNEQIASGERKEY
jgi:hypothetical protein